VELPDFEEIEKLRFLISILRTNIEILVITNTISIIAYLKK